jgi:hypothetical protein
VLARIERIRAGLPVEGELVTGDAAVFVAESASE